MAKVTTFSKPTIERNPLPHNAEAERAVLGAVLLDNAVMEEASLLREGDFFLESHRAVFRAMCVMHDVGEEIDLVTLHDHLSADDVLKKIGGIAYVAQLADGLPKASNISQYVEIVRRKALLRRVIAIADVAQQLAMEESEGEAIAEKAVQSLMDVAAEYIDKAQLGKTSKAAKISAIQQLEGRKSLLRINTGIEELDKLTGGFRSGELVAVTASETGAGKTLLAQQIRTNSCSNGFHGAYFTGEMPAEQLVSREMASETGVPHWKMRRPESLTKEEYSALVKNAGTSCEFCRIPDGELSLKNIRAACRRLKSEGKLSWAVIDYDELVEAPGKDEFAQQRNVIREAKRIAMTLEIPVFVISGIRKPLDSREAAKPMLSRIYGSGAKSKHSSFVLFVDRKYVRELKGSETDATIFILKSRDGRIGKIPVKFDLQTLRFEDITA